MAENISGTYNVQFITGNKMLNLNSADTRSLSDIVSEFKAGLPPASQERMKTGLSGIMERMRNGMKSDIAFINVPKKDSQLLRNVNMTASTSEPDIVEEKTDDIDISDKF